MSEQFTISTKGWHHGRPQVEKAAEDRGVSISKLIGRAVDEYLGHTEYFDQKATDRAEALNLPRGLVIENDWIDAQARAEAERAVWGEIPGECLFQFAANSRGTLRGHQLFEMLFEMHRDSEAKRRLNELAEQERAGAPANEDDIAFREEFGKLNYEGPHRTSGRCLTQWGE